VKRSTIRSKAGIWCDVFKNTSIFFTIILIGGGCENRETCIKKCDAQYKRCNAVWGPGAIGCSIEFNTCKKGCEYDYGR